MRYLILSDIHANLEALEAVVADAEGLYQQIVCLGDIVGYGPDPNAVTAWVAQNCEAVIRGNHDRACTDMTDLQYFNPVARAAAQWTLAELEEPHKDYLRSLPMGPAAVDNFRLVHGSLSDEDGYLITVEDAWLELDVVGSGVVFFGHTHIQGGFNQRGPFARVQRIDPDGLLSITNGDAFLVNPGSVGQPRDGNWHAAYAIYDASTGEAEFRRCAYDIDVTQRKIIESELPPVLAERLALGV
jgi:predicted phosphodiesterase